MVPRSPSVGGGLGVLLKEVVPLPPNLEHDLGVDATLGRSVLHRLQSSLEHQVTLLLALLDRSLDLVLAK